MTKEELREYQNYPLKQKIKLSNEIIQDFYENTPQDKVYISSSFGKDSTVLIHLVRKQFEDVPIVYVDTGVEHPSCIEISKQYENVIRLRPYKPAERIFEEYGFPLPMGKDKSGAVEQIRNNLHDGKFDTYRMRQIRGEMGSRMYSYEELQPIVFAPFKISDKCCYWIKEQPINAFAKKTGMKYAFVGITAEESMHRSNTIRKDGFNNKTQSRPLAFWKVHDILQYIRWKYLPLAECYGDIIEVNGKYKTSRHQRTGCICCPVSSHLEKPNKFELLHEFDFERWCYVMDDLKLREVLDYFNIPKGDENDGKE